MDEIIQTTKLTDEARQRLLEICTRAGGALTPQAVLDDARDKKSPLHSSFEWNNSEAANKYRLDQARAVIRDFHIIRIEANTLVRVPLFVHDPRRPAHNQGYVRVDAIRENRALVFRAMHREIVGALAMVHRAKALGEELGMSGLFEATIEQFNVARLKVDCAMVQPQPREAPGPQPAM